MGIPLHWSLQSDTRRVCLRFAPDSPGEAGPQWSHPLELEKSLSSTARYISLPVRPAAISGGKDTPLIDLEGGELGSDTSGATGSTKRKGSYLRELTTIQTAAAPAWDLQGLHPRIGRHIKHYSRCALGRFFYGHARRKSLPRPQQCRASSWLQAAFLGSALLHVSHRTPIP